jgi:hypothetical protein
VDFIDRSRQIGVTVEPPVQDDCHGAGILKRAVGALMLTAKKLANRSPQIAWLASVVKALDIEDASTAKRELDSGSAAFCLKERHVEPQHVVAGEVRAAKEP